MLIALHTHTHTCSLLYEHASAHTCSLLLIINSPVLTIFYCQPCSLFIAVLHTQSDTQTHLNAPMHTYMHTHTHTYTHTHTLTHWRKRAHFYTYKCCIRKVSLVFVADNIAYEAGKVKALSEPSSIAWHWCYECKYQVNKCIDSSKNEIYHKIIYYHWSLRSNDANSGNSFKALWSTREL